MPIRDFDVTPAIVGRNIRDALQALARMLDRAGNAA